MKLRKALIFTITAAALTVSACSGKSSNPKEGAEATPSGVESQADSKAESTEAEKSTESKVKAADINYGKAVKLGQYKGVEIETVDASISDEMLDAEINNQLSIDAELVEVTDRAAANGDTVNIDYEGKLDGTAFEGGTASGYDLMLGSGNFIAGFEEGLIGVHAGDERSLNLTFPTEYHSAELAGKAVVFDVKVNAVKTYKLPELNDEWVNTHTEGVQKTVAEFRDEIRKGMEEEAAKSALYQEKFEAMNKIIENSEFELDEAGVQSIIDSYIDNMKSILTAYGVTYESYIASSGITEEDMRNEMRPQAEDYAKRIIVSQAIIDAEKLELEDADYEAYAEEAGMGLEEMKAMYTDMSQLDIEVAGNMVMNFVHENAVKKAAD